jgi:hypothetical protein
MPIRNLTDRAYRYRANSNERRPLGRKVCQICGSSRNVGVDHKDGFEENNSPSNLRWLCKSCNTKMGIKMMREGKGRRTRQFNPQFTNRSDEQQYNIGQIIEQLDGTKIEILSKKYVYPNKYKYTYKIVERTNPSWFKDVPKSYKGYRINFNLLDGFTATHIKDKVFVGPFNSWDELKEHIDKSSRLKNFYPFSKDKPFIERTPKIKEKPYKPSRYSYSAREALAKRKAAASSRLDDKDIEIKLAAHYAKGGTLEEFLKMNPGLPLAVIEGLQSGAAWTAGSKLFGYVDKKVRGKRNPNSKAEVLTEKWHGRKPKKVTEVEERETYQEEIAELADLEELGVLGADLTERFTIVFKRDRPKLCAPDNENLEFVGGDQSLSNVPEGVEKDGKMLVPLGYCYQIVYETDKWHLEGSNGVMESYEHFFGEEFYKEHLDPDDFKNSDEWFDELLEKGIVEEAIEEGLLPMLVYNKTDEKLLIVGGKYEILDVGIRN